MHNSFILQQYIYIYIYIYIYVTLRSSKCFEQHAAHHQEDQLYHHILWYRHPLKQPYSMWVESGLYYLLL